MSLICKKLWINPKEGYHGSNLEDPTSGIVLAKMIRVGRFDVVIFVVKEGISTQQGMEVLD